MSFGIALAGGGCRGAAHVGMLMALEEYNITPSSIAGTSSGSIVAGLYSCGYTSKQLRDIVLDMSKKKWTYIDVNIKELFKTIPQTIFNRDIHMSGFIKGDKIEKYICSLTDGKYVCDVNIPLVIPAVDIISGETIAFSNKTSYKRIESVRWGSNIPLCQAIRASIAIPAIFEPKFINNLCLVDGGITNVLPVDLLTAIGEKNVLAIDISERYEALDDFSIFKIATNSFEIMRTYLKERTSTQERMLLKLPIPKDVDLLSFNKMEYCMEIGYDYTKKNISIIKYIFGY